MSVPNSNDLSQCSHFIWELFLFQQSRNTDAAQSLHSGCKLGACGILDLGLMWTVPAARYARWELYMAHKHVPYINRGHILH